MVSDGFLVDLAGSYSHRTREKSKKKKAACHDEHPWRRDSRHGHKRAEVRRVLEGFYSHKLPIPACHPIAVRSPQTNLASSPDDFLSRSLVGDAKIRLKQSIPDEGIAAEGLRHEDLGSKATGSGPQRLSGSYASGMQTKPSWTRTSLKLQCIPNPEFQILHQHSSQQFLISVSC